MHREMLSVLIIIQVYLSHFVQCQNFSTILHHYQNNLVTLSINFIRVKQKFIEFVDNVKLNLLII